MSVVNMPYPAAGLVSPRLGEGGPEPVELPISPEEWTSPESLELAFQLLEGRRPVPRGLAELHHEDVFSSTLSVRAAVKLGFAWGSTEGSYSDKYFIQEYSKYTEKSEGKGKVRWGIAIRWINKIRILDVKANFASLPVLSASAELGLVEAESKFMVAGLSSEKISHLIPAPEDLSVETYVKFSAALADIKDQIWAPDTVVMPTLLDIYGDLREEEEKAYDSSVAAIWALNQIWRGQTLSLSLESDPIKTGTSKSIIESVYIDVAGSNQMHAEPSKKARSEARRLARDLRVAKPRFTR